MKAPFILLFFFVFTLPVIAQNQYLLIVDNPEQKLINTVTSSEIKLQDKSSNFVSIKGKDISISYFMANDKGIILLNEMDNIGFIKRNGEFNFTLYDVKYTRIRRGSKWYYFADENEALVISIVKLDNKRIISIEKTNGDPIAELIALNESVMKMQNNKALPGIIVGGVLIGVARGLTYYR